MPLLKKKPYEPHTDLPTGLQSSEEVFVVRLTNEVFREYDEYIQRVMLYRQKVWSCKITGKTGFTYEEALASEEKAKDHLKEFPGNCVEPVIRMVHHSKIRLDELVSLIFSYFKDNYAPGEEIMAEQGGVMVPCRYLSREEAPPAGPTLEVEDGSVPKTPLLPENSPPKDHLCTVELINGSGSSICEVHMSKTLRKHKHAPFTKSLLKSWISNAAAHTAYGKINLWEAKPEYVSMYKLPSTPPADALAARAAAEEKKKLQQKKERKPPTPMMDANGHSISPITPAEDTGILATAAESTGGKKSGKRQASLMDVWKRGDSPATGEKEGAEHPPMRAVGSLEEERGRFKPGTVKSFCFQVLETAGPRGMKVGEMVAAMQERGIKDWSGVTTPRNTITTACSLDDAFLRVAPATFALRCLCAANAVPYAAPTPSTSAKKDKTEKTAKATPTAAPPPAAAAPAPPVLNPFIDFAAATDTAMLMDSLGHPAPAEETLLPPEEPPEEKVMINSERCNECKRKHDAEMTPLVLCDFCPRAFHLGCLKIQESDLPEGDWKCPRCVEKEEYQRKRLEEYHRKKAEQAAREEQRHREAQEAAERRAAEKLQREQEAAAREKQRQAEREERERQKQAEREERERLKEEDRLRKQQEAEARERAARYPIEDMLLVEEDAQEAAVDGRRPFPDTMPPPHLLGSPATREEGPADLAGPEGTLSAESEMRGDALMVAEFLTSFGKHLIPHAGPAVSFKGVVAAVECQPGGMALGELYLPLLWGVLGENSRLGALLNQVTWPEVLRQYILFSYESTRLAMNEGEEPPKATWNDLLTAAAALAKGSYHTLGAAQHLRLLHFLCDEVVGTLHMHDLIDRHAGELAEMARERAEAAAELRREQRAVEEAEREKRKQEREREREEKRRKAEEEAAKEAAKQPLITDAFQAEGADSPDPCDPSAADLNPDAKPKKEGKKLKKRSSAADVPDAGNAAEENGSRGPAPAAAPEEEEEPCFEIPADMVEYKGDPNDRKALLAHRKMVDKERERLEREKAAWERKKAALKRQASAAAAAEKARQEREARDAELAALEAEKERERERKREEKEREREREAALKEILTRPVRGLSMGSDRHHRQYWWFAVSPGTLHVLDVDTGIWGEFRTKEEVDALLGTLNDKGVRERGLKENLALEYNRLVSAMKKAAAAEAEAAAKVPAKGSRAQPRRGGMLSGDAPDPLAALVQADEAACMEACVAQLLEAGEMVEGAGGSVSRGWKVWPRSVEMCGSTGELVECALELEDGINLLGPAPDLAEPAPEAAPRAEAAAEAGAGAEGGPGDAKDEQPEATPGHTDTSQVVHLAWEWLDPQAEENASKKKSMWTSTQERAKWRADVGELVECPASRVAYVVGVLHTRSAPLMARMTAALPKPIVLQSKLKPSAAKIRGKKRSKHEETDEEEEEKEEKEEPATKKGKKASKEASGTQKRKSKESAEEQVGKPAKRQKEANSRSSKKAKEEEAQPEEEEEDHWNEDCLVCGGQGDLICCDGCSNVCHLVCAGLRCEPKGSWYCTDCRSFKTKKKGEEHSQKRKR